ncbi:hypothetical protein AUEXF2481DRAFT_6343 [Aureobasidium subglaciale EXF-2481]|uniref:MYND-type domain-containing protein n=1 Tax=Aureobasidium subglaciale (strain EXF-2481) TaxID=1043005 RepID=A0A074YI46_AURSE|nr:uncharacterized protein AUEXF2481DRAFT_6343 [Aureobasidium subglaciale EXF-2481]KAI5208770.1 hypothetical protein E4T38_02599 [Aureobasidium subglaciale]KAI5227530.1 hypothetical protein E4T40_02577 [Aureobasidium subglaciale]KAI5231009.1 hypothetical protein E4T41_02598 [Aureobasidium subglaciale]KAI5265206.1 hypothetical protein E4T46_02376 [Aureobasidium subglaciale]KEQ93757.1 hypothetical protein AUEXF2481DRAFT_6343 [Aureobasidium subglaciale EXF-2481]
MLDKAADLDKVKAEINADPEKCTFGSRSNESKEASKPTNKDVFFTLYNGAYHELHLPPEGVVRFGKALRDYRNGVPYSYITKGLLQTFSSGSPTYQESEVFWMRLEDVPAGEEITQQNTSLERIRGDFNQPVDVCGNCGAGQLYCAKTCQKAHTPEHSCVCPGFTKAQNKQPQDACGNCGAKQTKDGTALKRCGRCKGRNYCSVECQKEHYPMHTPKCKATVAEAKGKQEGGGRVKGLNVLETWR